jgi:hypothetical protein
LKRDDIQPIDLSGIKTYPLAGRQSKVTIDQLAKPPERVVTLADFFRSLPDILAAKDLKEIIRAVRAAAVSGKPIVMAMGAHVIKNGLNPVLVRMMEKGFITGLAFNGACIIHDFEIAFAGATSEDVGAALGDGRFGMAEETGRYLNEAINQGVSRGWGIGRSVGHFLNERKPPYLGKSVLAAADRLEIPATVHVAIGTDIIHMHPSVSGARIGEGTHLDFRIFASLISELNEGGVYINAGSAVILPEVFLKAVTLVRNSGRELKNFTTVNLDFIRHYRPTENVVKRPVLEGGRGFSLTGHHEILLPLIAFGLEIE